MNDFILKYGFSIITLLLVMAAISFILAIKELIELIGEERTNGKKR